MVQRIAGNTAGVSASMAKALLEGSSGNRGTRYACPEIPRIPDKGRDTYGTDTHELSGFSLTATPNPASTQVVVDYTLPSIPSQASLRLLNVLGETLTERRLENQHGNIVINLGNLPAGVYLLVLSDLNGCSCSRKVVKQ